VVLALFLIAVASIDEDPATSGDDKVTEVRQHFVAKTVNGQSLYVATDITQLTKDHDLNIIALLTDRDTVLIFTRDRNYSGQDVTYEIRDSKRKAFVKLTFAFPYAARTRDETIAEAKTVKTTGSKKFTIETSGIVISMDETDWRDPDKAREWRSEIRESLDPIFLESLERLRGAFNVDPRLRLFHDLVLGYVFHGRECDEESDGTLVLPVTADCDFDRRAGFRCSEKQIERVKKALADKEQLLAY
jgi:hypothetical protein